MSWTLYFDGASRGNPGESGAGAYLIENGSNKSFELVKKLGRMTNNQAEYISIKIGLDKFIELMTTENFKSLHIKGDSMLVINQLLGRYRVKSPNIIPYYQSVQAQINKIKKKNISVTFTHVKREFNKKADSLANRAIDSI